MIKLNRAELRDKIYACFLGKNIGGTLGTPFEGRREVLDVKGFNSEPGNPLPNDDLDLQLIWLNAVMNNGRNINERVLGEYWQTFITPFWNEYGVGKGNMARGLIPPVSGEYENDWKHSNGAWIRTEIWACLNPALVEESIRYGYMDACVDHGKGDGTYATIFVAAMESAAFAVSDIRELINIGLSKIPEDCRFYQYIKTVLDMYDSGKTWLETRNKITDMALADEELGWFQAPANVSYVVIGLLYGEGDFKKTLITAVNCGDDTDCTGATAGAILGILKGTEIIPDDWKAYIGDKIVTIAVNRGACRVPATCTELTDIIMEMHKMMLLGKNAEVYDGETETPAKDVENYKGKAFSEELAKRGNYFFDMDFVLTRIGIDFDDKPSISPNGEIGIKVTVTNKIVSQKHYGVRFVLPSGWTVSGKKDMYVKNKKHEYGHGTVSENYTIRAGDTVEAKNRIIIEITCEGHSDTALVPLVILG
ncbi:MAG: ADP-ribosylglycohydrolase family protein [Clostridia bacterium]|nr:ADP-ribosylglycohydrolase family protein [Clostridia bacterium]